MRNLVATLLLGLAAVTSIASAEDLSLSADVNAGSRLIYRGVELSQDVTYGGGARAELFGVYGEGSTNTLTTTPVTDTRFRTDVGFGYHNGLGVEGLDLDASLHRVINPNVVVANVGGYNVYQGNYNEARFKASYNVAGFATVYGEYAQVVSTGYNEHDQYYALGLEGQVFTPKFVVGGLVSGQHYNAADVSRYNNSELYARYTLLKGLDLQALYSFGGKYANNTDIDNQAFVGVRYTF